MDEYVDMTSIDWVFEKCETEAWWSKKGKWKNSDKSNFLKKNNPPSVVNYTWERVTFLKKSLTKVSFFAVPIKESMSVL